MLVVASKATNTRTGVRHKRLLQFGGADVQDETPKHIVLIFGKILIVNVEDWECILRMLNTSRYVADSNERSLIPGYSLGSTAVAQDTGETMEYMAFLVHPL